MPPPPTIPRALALAPFASGLAWLCAELFAGQRVDPFEGVGLLIGVVVAPTCAIATLVSFVCARRAASPEARERWRVRALLLPCALAPLFLACPWVVAPSHLGPALGSARFFVGWLTRYPNLGPINLEVLLGMGAVLGTCAVPAALAAYVALAPTPRRWVPPLLAGLQLVAYVPVLLRLDVDLVTFAVATSHDAVGLVSLLAIGGGPIAHLGATLAMLAFAVRSIRA